jgi:putative transcriptional regulator
VSRWLAAICLLWLAVAPVAAATVQPDAGVLLVAREGLPDPRFHQTVVLLLQHGPEGTAGLIINRPTRLGLAEALPELPALAAETLCYGGPVAPRAFIVLVKAEEQPPEPSQKVFDGVYLTGAESLATWLDEVRPGGTYRVFAGYAGWAPDQLAGELARGDWQVLRATEPLLFTADPGGLWRSLAGGETVPSPD